jgi:TRAP-type mannitol/chloroaromatic compound transport system substrate-binding protein
LTSAHTAWFSDDDKPKTTTAQDHKTYTLKLAETWPSNFPIFGDATKKLVASVATDDRLDAVFGVNLIHQFLSATVFNPSVLLSCCHIKGATLATKWAAGSKKKSTPLKI